MNKDFQMDNLNNKTRIACYALIAKNAGSLASANFLIIEEILKRGYKIDFYSMNNFNNPEELSDYEDFNYINISIPLINVVWRFLETLPNNGGTLYAIWARLSASLYFKQIANTAKFYHKEQKYDLSLFLGLPGFFKLKNTPTISWLQGTFQTEWQTIKKFKKQIILLCGIKEYLKLEAFYIYSSLVIRKLHRMTDIFICGSQWSKEMLSSWGLAKNNIKVLPYPIDVSFFSPNPIEQKNKENKITFLWLGRIVPRKRLDLLLEAFSLLAKEHPNVYLKIIGSFSYAKKYKQLLDNFEFRERVFYQENINRLNVPGLMNSIDVLIQPSEAENFGSSVAEALSCGVPVIVGATNGTKDYISPSSFIFKEYSPESLKTVMKMAIDALDKNREEISHEARLTAEKEFDTLKVVDKLEVIFKDAIKRYGEQ